MKKVIPVLSHFLLAGNIAQIIPFGNGHIHTTYRLINADSNCPDYLLQKINHQIFKAVPEMMDNIYQITHFLGLKNPNDPQLQLIPTKDKKDQYFYKDQEGNYWRIYLFLKDLISHDIAVETNQIYEGAKAFGKFLYQLRDFPIHRLHILLPNFHDVISRLSIFEKTYKQDNFNRVKEVIGEVKFIRQHASKMSALQRLGNKGKIPLWVTHNDTKFNNVLLDKNGKGKCVIDLDTVMPGYIHFDFGDGIRSAVMKAPEDEVDLHLIQPDMDRFEAFANGYFADTKDLLIPIEKQYLALSGPMLSYIMGLRFLTDYLAGDIYYKIHFEKHNLQRAKAQLNLTKKLLERMEDMERIVDSL